MFPEWIYFHTYMFVRLIDTQSWTYHPAWSVYICASRCTPTSACICIKSIHMLENVHIHCWYTHVQHDAVNTAALGVELLVSRYGIIGSSLLPELGRLFVNWHPPCVSLSLSPCPTLSLLLLLLCSCWPVRKTVRFSAFWPR